MMYGTNTRQQFNTARYQTMVDLHKALVDLLDTLPDSSAKSSAASSLDTIRSNLAQMCPSISWIERIAGKTQYCDYMDNPNLFDSEYRQNMAELQRINRWIAQQSGTANSGINGLSAPGIFVGPNAQSVLISALPGAALGGIIGMFAKKPLLGAVIGAGVFAALEATREQFFATGALFEKDRPK